MSENAQERYAGGVRPARARPRWRTTLVVIGALDLIGAAVLTTVVVTHHGNVLGCQTLTPPAGSQPVWEVAFSPDGRTLATAVGIDGRTDLWNVTTGQRTATLRDPYSGGRGASVAFSPDGTLAVIDGGDGADLWNVTTHRMIAALTKADDSADAMAFSPDGRMLAVDGLAGDVALWDVTNGHLIADLDNPSGYARISLAFAPDGQMLAAADAGEKTEVWNVRTGRLITTLTTPDYVEGVAFSPDGRTLALAELHGKVILREVATWRPIGTLTAPGGGGIDAVAFSPDGRMLAVGTANRRVYVWDVATWRLIDTAVTPDGGTVSGLAFSPDSRTLAFSDGGESAYLCPMSN
jgi:WD40 repeat protein